MQAQRNPKRYDFIKKTLILMENHKIANWNIKDVKSENIKKVVLR